MSEDLDQIESQLLNDKRNSESEILRFFLGVWDFTLFVVGEINRFLESRAPSIIFLVAAGLFILAEIAARVAVYFIPKMESINQTNSHGQQWTMPVESGSIQAVSFFTSCSQYMQFAGMMIGVWALFRLISDAIKSGAKND